MRTWGPQDMGVIMHQAYQNEVPVLGALVLSPIQELDSGSVNNTLHAGQPGTTALAQAVLSPGLGQGWYFIFFKRERESSRI